MNFHLLSESLTDRIFVNFAYKEKLLSRKMLLSISLTKKVLLIFFIKSISILLVNKHFNQHLFIYSTVSESPNLYCIFKFSIYRGGFARNHLGALIP